MSIVSTKMFTNFADGKKGRMSGIAIHCENAKAAHEVKKRNNSYSKYKERQSNREINSLRQEAIHDRGFDLNKIYHLCADDLKGLLAGVLVFNDYNQLVEV